MLENFFLYGSIPANAESGTYVPALVLVSYLVASAGSYAGLTLATQLLNAPSKLKQRLLHCSGAVALGSGIWSMHFIGMLALKMRMTVHYDAWLTIVSILIAIGVAYFVLQVIQTTRLSFLRISIAAVLLGFGICAMHYTGMAAMEMQAALRYIPSYFLLSVLIAIAASGAALWILFMLGRRSGRGQFVWRIVAALIMGAAICGMHYTGMMAAVFIPFADCRFDANQSFELLAAAVMLSTTVLLFILTAAISRRLFLIAGIGFLLMLPLVSIIHQATSALNADILIAEKEQYGVYYHTQLISLIERLQEVRGLRYIIRNGGDALSPQLQSRMQSLSNVIVAVDEVDQSYKNKLAVTQGWQKIRGRIMSLIDNKNVQTADLEFAQYTEVIESLIVLVGDVADNSGISTDPQLSSDYLAIASTHILPKIIETTARFRGLTSGLLISGKPPSKWGEKLIEDIHVLGEQLGVQDDGVLAEALQRAKQASADSDEFVSYHAEYIKPKITILQNYAEEIGRKRKIDLSMEEIFKLGSDAVAAYDTLYDRISDKFLGLLQQRREAYTQRRDLVIYSSAAAFLGFIALFVFLYRSLTRTERSEQETRRAGAQTQAIMENVLEGIITIDRQGIIQTFNGAAEQAFGYSHDEVVGKNVKILMPSPYQEQHDGYMQRYHDTGEKKIIGVGREAVGLRKNGMQFPIVLSVSEIKVGSTVLYIGLVRDITLQKQKEEELRIAKETAETANIAKSEFLANMSHELRTPLNSILGMLRFLKEAELPDEERHTAETAFRASTNLLEIVNDILDLSKIEAGEMQLERIGMDVTYILDSVVHTLGHIAAEKRLPLVLQYEKEKIPFVLGDPTRLTQILNNLVGNAIKYTSKGRVEVNATARPLGGNRIELRFVVADTGIGIPKDKLQLVFEKFVQADTTTTRKYGGTGLGLAITRQLVEIMGGTIGVDSEVYVGSRFWCTIPFEITDQLSGEKHNRKKNLFAGTIAPAKARILVAEDHPMNQILITKLLKRLGIETFEIADNGVEAIVHFCRAHWDIVLMDCHMPKKNGYDTTKDIREFERGTDKHTPIIAMTANAMIGDREKCLRYGMDEYISKPIDIDEFKDVLSQWIRFEDVPSANQNLPQADATAPLVLAVLKDFSEGDVVVEQQLAHAFVQQSDKNLATLDQYKATTEAKAWHEAAHMLKGGASGIGARILSDLCAQAQNFSGTSHEQSALFEKIAAEYARVKEYLKNEGLIE